MTDSLLDRLGSGANAAETAFTFVLLVVLGFAILEVLVFVGAIGDNPLGFVGDVLGELTDEDGGDGDSGGGDLW